MDKFLEFTNTKILLSLVSHIRIRNPWITVAVGRSNQEYDQRSSGLTPEIVNKTCITWIMIKKGNDIEYVNPKYIVGRSFYDANTNFDIIYLANGTIIESHTRTGFNRATRREVEENIEKNATSRVKVTYGC